MIRTRHVPMRLCVGCGERDAQSRLRRLALRDGLATWDVGRRLPGRGAYLHLQASCLDSFERRKPFLRSLRAAVARDDRRRLVSEAGASYLA